MNRKAIILLSFLMFFVSAITQAENLQGKDEHFRNAAIGTWIVKMANDLVEMNAEVEYQQNGKMIASGYLITPYEKIEIAAEGKWRISEGKFYEIIEKSNIPDTIGVLIDIIVSVDQRQLVRKDEESGAITVFNKKQE